MQYIQFLETNRTWWLICLYIVLYMITYLCSLNLCMATFLSVHVWLFIFHVNFYVFCTMQTQCCTSLINCCLNIKFRYHLIKYVLIKIHFLHKNLNILSSYFKVYYLIFIYLFFLFSKGSGLLCHRLAGALCVASSGWVWSGHRPGQLSALRCSSLLWRSSRCLLRSQRKSGPHDAREDGRSDQVRFSLGYHIQFNSSLFL